MPLLQPTPTHMLIGIVIDYKRIEDIRGQCDTLYKKSIIARLRGDIAVAEDWNGRYLTLYNAHMKSLNDDDNLSEGHDPDTVNL